MSRPHIPLLTLSLVPLLALTSRTREPAGDLVCPSRSMLVGVGGGASVELPGAPEGASSSEGLVLEDGAHLQLPLPPHHGWVQVRIRADHDDRYVLEVPSSEGWSLVGEFERAEPPGLRNRPVVEIPVDNARLVALSPRGSQASLSMVCLRGARWTIPVWMLIAFSLGALFVLFRSIPHPLAARLTCAYGRADPVLALAFGVAVLTTPLLLVTIPPAWLGLRAWRSRASTHRATVER